MRPALGLTVASRPAPQEPAALAELATTGARLREGLRAEGLAVVAAEDCAAPAVITVQLPGEMDPALVADRLAGDGFLLAAHSSYLRRGRRLQISLMGRPAPADLEALPALLSRQVQHLSRRSGYAPAPGRRAAAPAGSL